jgi:hypothetical protein
MKNIYILMTDKPTWFHKSILTGVLRKSSSCIDDMRQAYGVNIHITSDEKFVKDEYITDGMEVIRATPKLVDAQGLVNRRDWKKIILSTDEVLIKDGVQKIGEGFLNWFVKNPSCERIEFTPYLKDIIDPATNIKYPSVQFGHFDETKMIFRYHYELIVPNEESKQETLEETIDKASLLEFPIKEWYRSDDYNREEITAARDGFKRGAKWMKEQYTIEEQHIGHSINDSDKEYIKGFNEGSKWQQEQDKNKFSEKEVLDLIQFLSMNVEFSDYSSVSIDTGKYFLRKFKNK